MEILCEAAPRALPAASQGKLGGPRLSFSSKDSSLVILVLPKRQSLEIQGLKVEGETEAQAAETAQAIQVSVGSLGDVLVGQAQYSLLVRRLPRKYQASCCRHFEAHRKGGFPQCSPSMAEKHAHHEQDSQALQNLFSDIFPGRLALSQQVAKRVQCCLMQDSLCSVSARHAPVLSHARAEENQPDAQIQQFA